MSHAHTHTQRYFILEMGVLYFSRNQTQMHKGKGVALLDLGLAFLHNDVSSRRITIDGEQQVLHLKVQLHTHVCVCVRQRESLNCTLIALIFVILSACLHDHAHCKP